MPDPTPATTPTLRSFALAAVAAASGPAAEGRADEPLTALAATLKSDEAYDA